MSTDTILWQHGAYATAFEVALLLFVITGIRPQLRTLRLRFLGAGSTDDRLSYQAVSVLGFGSVVLAFVVALHLTRFEMTWNRPLQFDLGIGLMIAGTTVTWIAVRQLDRYFTVQVMVQEGQRIVDTGLYRLIRHPSYTGQIVFLLGIAITMTNWLSVSIVLLGAALGYGYRVRVEESALRASLGDSYSEYARRTHRFIPWIL